MKEEYVDQEYVEDDRPEKITFVDAFLTKQEDKQAKRYEYIEQKRALMYGDLAYTYEYDDYHEKQIRRQLTKIGQEKLGFLGTCAILLGVVLTFFQISGQIYVVFQGVVMKFAGQLQVQSVNKVEENYELNLRKQYEEEYLENRDKIQEEYLKNNPLETEVYK